VLGDKKKHYKKKAQQKVRKIVIVSTKKKLLFSLASFARKFSHCHCCWLHIFIIDLSTHHSVTLIDASSIHQKRAPFILRRLKTLFKRIEIFMIIKNAKVAKFRNQIFSQ
jgi:hypothetical protein